MRRRRRRRWATGASTWAASTWGRGGMSSSSRTASTPSSTRALQVFSRVQCSTLYSTCTVCTVFFCLRDRFPSLTLRFSIYMMVSHNDPAALQVHCGRCRVRTWDLYPCRSLVLYLYEPPHLHHVYTVQCMCMYSKYYIRTSTLPEWWCNFYWDIWSAEFF